MDFPRNRAQNLGCRLIVANRLTIERYQDITGNKCKLAANANIASFIQYLFVKMERVKALF
jgi:Na+-transporting NADH:ubiquinone oxidoreductase subunit NqrF